MAKEDEASLQERLKKESTPLEDDDTTNLGITFKSFEVSSVLGHGSYGTVYSAFLKTDPLMKPLAMKVQNKKTLLKKK